MKVAILVLAALCCVVQAQFFADQQKLQCFDSNARSDQYECLRNFNNLGTALGRGGASNNDFAQFCSTCGVSLNSLFKTCNWEILNLYCSADDKGFCLLRTVDISGEAAVAARTCLSTSCTSSPTCGQAVQSVSCCYGTVILPFAPNLFPSDCQVKQCSVKMGGAISSTVAMPMIAAILIALIAIAEM